MNVTGDRMTEALPPGPASDAPEALIAAADRLYRERDWRAALDQYALLQARHPEFAIAHAVALTIGHCAIELAPRGVPDRPAEVAGVHGTERDLKLITDLRLRVLELCFARDFERATQLLHLLARCDRSVQSAYETISKGPSSCLQFLDATPEPVDPPFLKTLTVPAHELAAAQRRHQGKRLLLVCQRYFVDPLRRHDMADNIGQSARDFGLVVRELNSHVLAPGATIDGFAGDLLGEIIAFRPDVILFDDLYHLGISAASESVAEQVATVLEQARASLGVKVVRSLPDAWNTVLKGDAHLFRGLGSSVDLLHHQSAAALDRGTPEQRAATWCYVYPILMEPPTIAPRSIPRACFAGGVHYASMARVVWWTETARLGVPLDFVITLPWQTDHLNQPPVTDIEYSNLLGGHQLAVNLTQRLGGAGTLTGRLFEAMLVGGVVLEEASVDAAYFFQPGVHYMPFASLADLATLIERLLADQARRDSLAEAGQSFASRYFTGTQFWAELLGRLERL